jgi:hypothetical protein
MDISVAIAKIKSEMIERGLIAETVGNNNNPLYDFYFGMLYTAGYEQARKELTAHNKRKVAQYDRRGVLLNTYDSIKEASKILKVSRDVIDDSVTGRIPLTRRGKYYFRYLKSWGI